MIIYEILFAAALWIRDVRRLGAEPERTDAEHVYATPTTHYLEAT